MWSSLRSTIFTIKFPAASGGVSILNPNALTLREEGRCPRSFVHFGRIGILWLPITYTLGHLDAVKMGELHGEGPPALGA